MRSLLLFVVSLIFLPSTAVGLTFSTPLDDLVGVIDFLAGRGSRQAAFDFGQQFLAIESVSIELEEIENAFVYDECGFIFAPQPCVRRTRLLGFFVRMDEEDKPFLGSISTGVSLPGDREAVQGSGVASGEFANPSPTGWDLLLDGRGSITLFWNSLLFIPEQVLVFRQNASGEIFSARLIIEGTPIPEPSTALLLATGLLALAGWRGSD